MELELDVEVPGTLGRDPFTNGNPILYASLQFLVPREDKAVESFKAERFRKQISAVAGKHPEQSCLFSRLITAAGVEHNIRVESRKQVLAATEP
jgi:hypothetical protein